MTSSSQSVTIQPLDRVRATITPPGDKSITHRAIILSAVAAGHSKITHASAARDCVSTMEVCRALGVQIDEVGEETLLVHGQGLRGLHAPRAELYAGNSGTTMRLMLGVLAGHPFQATLTGDASLSKRPMQRVTQPLRRMGADIRGKRNANFAPLTITGGALRGMHHTNTIPSAQVKSAILLAGLYAQGTTSVVEPIPSRDHTERMLPQFGVEVHHDGNEWTVHPPQALHATQLAVPGDLSAAAFFLVLGAVHPRAEITAERVGLNPTRTGIVHALQAMGGDLRVQTDGNPASLEPTGLVVVKSSQLRGCEIDAPLIPQLIDELPILMVAAALATGETRISGAEELRVKETDRIHAMCENLRILGVHVQETPDGCVIQGGKRLLGGKVKSYGDHRIAMSMVIAGYLAKAPVTIDDVDCIAISDPTFLKKGSSLKLQV